MESQSNIFFFFSSCLLSFSMDLIQQYQSDSESESEFESEREEEVGLNKEQENNPKVNNQEKCESESSLPQIGRAHV